MAKVNVVCELNQGVQFDLANGEKVTINGWKAQALDGVKFKITELEQAVWDEVLKVYGHMDMFVQGFIYANTTKAKARDQAEERLGEKRAIDQLDPNGKEIKGAGVTQEKEMM